MPLDPNLRYTSRKEAVAHALAFKMEKRTIVRELTRGMTYEEARKIAIEIAPALGISVADFMRLRRNA